MSTQQPLNLWSYKPWWCQPWSILLTGATTIVGSWVLLKTVWVTALISSLILLWWTYFLVLWPWLVKISGSRENPPQPPQNSTSQVGD